MVSVKVHVIFDALVFLHHSKFFLMSKINSDDGIEATLVNIRYNSLVWG